MIIHKSTVNARDLKRHFVTPVGDRQRSDVIELIRFDRLRSEEDPTYVRSVQFNVSAGFVPQGFIERLKSAYRSLERGEYHQILIRIPKDLKLIDLLTHDDENISLEDGDIIEWSISSYAALITNLRAILKDDK